MRYLVLFKPLMWASVLCCILLNLYLKFYPLVKLSCSWYPESTIKIAAFGDPQISGQVPVKNFRKHIDILGNDKFLAQVARTIRSQLSPRYVAILGDLISSQWISTEEFEIRAERYKKIFPANENGQIVNITGNHDIGYHGDLNDERVDRYIKHYGALNYVVHQSEEWRLIVLNDVSLDGPPYDDKWHNESLNFIHGLANYTGSTILLTHIPLYKPAGICFDSPHFSYYYETNLRTQNCLTIASSNLILDNLFGGSSKGGIILNGHDHEGCYSEHAYDAETHTWQIVKSNGNVKEYTVRSMMGEFGGNCGLLSGVDTDDGVQWHFNLCRFHIQHIWWVTQVFTYISIMISPLLFI